MELSLAFIGWFFSLICAGALALGAALIAIMARAGDLERRYLGYSVWNDLLLAAIWALGLAGGIGVLRLQPWGRYLLELFCWALIVLAPLSAASRLYALRRPRPDSKARELAGRDRRRHADPDPDPDYLRRYYRDLAEPGNAESVLRELSAPAHGFR